MTRSLIWFDAHAMDHIPDEDMPTVAKASHEVVRKAMNAGVWVFGGRRSGTDPARRPIRLAREFRSVGCASVPEAAHQVAMHAESVLGHRQAIVGRYEPLCQELDTRFGLEPEHETRVLYRRLLSQDGREALRHLSPAPASPEGVRRY
jgi:Bacterial transcriptional activator domain